MAVPMAVQLNILLYHLNSVVIKLGSVAFKKCACSGGGEEEKEEASRGRSGPLL